jgi:hypothetical protein
MLRKRLKDAGLLVDGFLRIDFSGPHELSLKKNDRWELSYEGRSDDGPDFSGCGFDELCSILESFGVPHEVLVRD